MAVYGGHRVWQGFASKNSYANSWADTSELPTGGCVPYALCPLLLAPPHIESSPHVLRVFPCVPPLLRLVQVFG